MKYDIFVSYRRTDASTANLIAEKLKSLGYSVFFDVETLRGGLFNDQLFNVIDKCTDLVLVLPQNALDRCISEDDWIRQEVCYAMSKNLNIVPILLSGFEWPDPMPWGMEQLKFYQALTASNHDYFDLSIKKLTTYLKSKPSKKHRYIQNIAIISITILILIGSGIVWFIHTNHVVCESYIDKYSYDVGRVHQLYKDTERLSDIWNEYISVKKSESFNIKEDTIYLSRINNLCENVKQYDMTRMCDTLYSKTQINILTRYNMSEADIKAVPIFFDVLFREFYDNVDLMKQYISGELAWTPITNKVIEMRLACTFPAYMSIFYAYASALNSVPRNAIKKSYIHSNDWNYFPFDRVLTLTSEECDMLSTKEIQKRKQIVEGYKSQIEEIKQQELNK